LGPRPANAKACATFWLGIYPLGSLALEPRAVVSALFAALAWHVAATADLMQKRRRAARTGLSNGANTCRLLDSHSTKEFVQVLLLVFLWGCSACVHHNHEDGFTDASRDPPTMHIAKSLSLRHAKHRARGIQNAAAHEEATIPPATEAVNHLAEGRGVLEVFVDDWRRREAEWAYGAHQDVHGIGDAAAAHQIDAGDLEVASVAGSTPVVSMSMMVRCCCDALQMGIVEMEGQCSGRTTVRVGAWRVSR
jgi:hypothetical protein